MRHDWFPVVPGLTFAVANVMGWDPTGMGAPNGYPASFLAIFIRSALASALGSYPTHVLFFSLCALLLAFGAARLSRVLGAAPPAGIAAALFAAFNPWTYTELVAGHTFMLLSYAATFWIIAECCAHRRNETRLIPLAFIMAPQIQFLIVNFFFYLWLALRMRSWRTFAAIAATLLPVAAGIAMSRSTLLGIPLTLEWERSQSLWPLRAVILSGYFAHYDASLAPFVEWAGWFVVALALGGVLVIATTRKRELWLVAFAALPLIWSFGLDGPFAAGFRWAIAHVPEVALFRELYDLLGFVAIGYVAFCAVAAARAPILGWGWLLAGLALATAWWLAPPARYWVPSQDLPIVRVPQQHNARFALVPGLYPASFAQRGSGTDPELYARAGNLNPVNEAFSLYPVSSALGSFMRDGSVTKFAALSVGAIVARPWLATDPSIRYQFALPAPPWLYATVVRSRSVPSVTPELSLGAMPAVGTLASNLGAGNVLSGDAREVTGPFVPSAWHEFSPVRPMRAGDAFVSAALGWVDARLGFVEMPELGQSYGGALTTNAAAVLPIEPGREALVWVRGKLVDPAGRPLARETNGYRWIHIPSDVRAVRCLGLCVVAAQGSFAHALPLDPPQESARGVDFQAPVPWLVLAKLPAGAKGLLRYNVTFDRKWIAVYASRLLPHVRIDGVVNGWIAPPRAAQGRVMLLETGALVVACSELLATILIALLLSGCVATAYRERRNGGRSGTRAKR